MKMIRKSILMLIAVIMALTILPLSAFAQTSSTTPTMTEGSGEILLGDINGDGKVSAADSRIILRIALRLEKVENFKGGLVAADVDKNGKITTVDARKALRIAIGAKDEPETDYSNMPSEILAFCNGNYFIEGNFNCETDPQYIKMATKGEAKEMLFALDGIELGLYSNKNNEILINYSNKTYAKLSEIEQLMNSFDSSIDMSFSNIVFGGFNIDSATSENTTVNGKQACIWTITSGEKRLLFTVIDGEVKRIKDENKDFAVEVISLSSTLPANYYISNSKQYKYSTALAFMISLMR